MRTEWVAKRQGQKNVSQMHYARQGVITEEMDYVAKRENLPASLIQEALMLGLWRCSRASDQAAPQRTGPEATPAQVP